MSKIKLIFFKFLSMNLLIKENRQNFFGYKFQMTKLQKKFTNIGPYTYRTFKRKRMISRKWKLTSSGYAASTKIFEKDIKVLMNYQSCTYIIKKNDGTIIVDTTNMLSR